MGGGEKEHKKEGQVPPRQRSVLPLPQSSLPLAAVLFQTERALWDDSMFHCKNIPAHYSDLVRPPLMKCSLN